jgi:hypothetical protein
MLREEPHPAVRVVLGHFIFVYIHPLYGQPPRRAIPDEHHDGVEGYPWTVIPVTDRNAYANALEKASVGEDIADFLAGAGAKTTGGRALAGGAESFGRRRTLKQFSICSERRGEIR